MKPVNLESDHPNLNWRHGLLLSTTGGVLPILANATRAFRSAPQWQGVLGYNEFENKAYIRSTPPWWNGSDFQEISWSDHFDALATEWLHNNGIRVTVSVTAIAIDTVAREHGYHPIRNYLDNLKWDGTPRIDNWLCCYVGAIDSPYIRAVGSKWLISGVARIYKPGAKADHVLILEGPQGMGKSGAFKVIASPWFVDHLSNLSEKDAAVEIQGAWIIEMAELDALSRSEVSTVKAFLSRTHDRYRPPYGKRVEERARQCIFGGTVNVEGGYFKDATGNRRFWPVRANTIDAIRLERDRDQLWAEACVRYKNGETWWPDSLELVKLASQEQDERYFVDSLEEPIEKYLNEVVPQRNEVSISEILKNVMNLPEGQWKPNDERRVVRILQRLDFSRRRPTRDGERVWLYTRNHSK